MSTVQRVAGAAAALTLCAALTSCEYLASTIPNVPTPSATAASTPAETAMQRQMRLDYAAAEKAYRTAVVESGRVIAQGATQPSARLENVATGDYLATTMSIAKQVHESAYTSRGSTSIEGVVGAGWQEKKVELTTCEDVSRVKYFQAGKQIKMNSSPYYVQHLSVIKTDNSTWKVSDQDTTQLKSLAGQPCAGN